MVQACTLKHIFNLDVLEHGRMLEHTSLGELSQVLWGRATLEHFHVDSWKSQFRSTRPSEPILWFSYKYV
jgi:hypothetical protein